MTWMLASIPKEKKHLMDEVAAQCGIRAVEGIPTLHTRGGMRIFPAQGPHVYTLENTSGHPVYRNDPSVDRALMDQERISVRSVLHKKT